MWNDEEKSKLYIYISPNEALLFRQLRIYRKGWDHSKQRKQNILILEVLIFKLPIPINSQESYLLFALQQEKQNCKSNNYVTKE